MAAPAATKPPGAEERGQAQTLRGASSDAAGRPRIDVSSTSATCAIGITAAPSLASARVICSAQPGLAETSSSAPAARTLPALRAPSSAAASGWTRL
jgi:hypothetical protein